MLQRYEVSIVESAVRICVRADAPSDEEMSLRYPPSTRARRDGAVEAER